MFRNPIYFFSFFFICIFFGGCGIPDYPYLAPPVVTNKNDNFINYTAGFNNASENNPQYFQGYVFYYRFFNTEQELQNFINSIANAEGREDLKDYFSLFRVETTGDKAPAPLLEIDVNDRPKNFSVNVNFGSDIIDVSSGGFGSIITWTVSSVTYSINIKRRILQIPVDPLNYDYEDRSFKRDNFFASDSDIPSDYQNTGTLYLSLFVLSFGRDDNGSPLFSVPVELGRFLFPSDY